MVHNVKAGIAAASSLAGTAMAYKNYGNNSGNNGAKPQTKNNCNSSWQKSSNSSSSKNGGKLHDDAVKQMQMWKF